jgi:hypothetical protein
MHGWHKIWAGAIVLATALLIAPAAASAQLLIKYNEGPGLKLGDAVVFHPGAAVQTSYDSNVFYNASDEGVKSAPLINSIIHLDLSTLSPQRMEGQEGKASSQVVDFRLRFAGAYRAFISSNENIKKQSNFDVDTGLNALFNPKGKVRFRVFDDFLRTITPQNTETTGSYIRDYDVGGADLAIAPGGEMLTFKLGYQFTLDHWENKWSNGLSSFNPDFYGHQFGLEAKWKFLPKTAAFLQVTEGINSRPDYLINNVKHPDSYPLRVWAGLVGQLTYLMSVTVRAGYGNGFYQGVTGRASVGNFNNFVGGAEFAWQLTTTGKLKIGYDRNFYDSLWSDYYTDDRVYLGYDHMFFSRLILHLDGGYRYRQYEGLDAAVWGVTSRNDNVVDAHAGVDYRILDWLYVGVGYDLWYDGTSARPSFGGVADNPSYTKHVAWFKVDVSY